MNFFTLLIALLVGLVAGAPTATSTLSSATSSLVYTAMPVSTSTAPIIVKCPQNCMDDMATCQTVCILLAYPWVSFLVNSGVY